MKNTLLLLCGLAAVATLATGCSFESSANALAPSSVHTTTTAASSTFAGVWRSETIGTPSAGSCGDFQWQITSETTTSIAGNFAATCAGDVTIAGTATGQLQGTTVPITATGTATLANSISCDFSISGNGTIDGDTLTIPYSGTTCMGPVHGTEQLKKRKKDTPVDPTPVDPLFGCGGIADDNDLVHCIWDHIHPTDQFSAFEVTKRVAWARRTDGAGLLIKNGGDNIVLWQGRSFSAGRICFPDGRLVKVISDVGPGGANGPSWQDNGYVDPSLYVPAIDPLLQ